ncbi:hypothetical protein [Nocardioides sp. Iso805N]|uniref:hypothetical protein n=1 Tax=Nocardioides sp. Iso805N TaxID=1283287 RepID=UPI0012F947D7|nr:hypothetical protein [Nocardioides sp. Iso805N]
MSSRGDSFVAVRILGLVLEPVDGIHPDHHLCAATPKRGYHGLWPSPAPRLFRGRAADVIARYG